MDKDANEDVAVQFWNEKVTVLLVEIQFQELLYEDWLRWQRHSAGGLAAQPVPFT